MQVIQVNTMYHTHNKELYSVFVDGNEVNNYLMTYEDAKDLADDYKEGGYTNIVISCLY